MKREKKDARLTSGDNAPRWSRRAFGLFAATAASTMAIWRPHVARPRPNISGKVADHWTSVAEKSGESK